MKPHILCITPHRKWPHIEAILHGSKDSFQARSILGALCLGNGLLLIFSYQVMPHA